eukprot:6184-Heterococcus_DN1.PRE.1
MSCTLHCNSRAAAHSAGSERSSTTTSSTPRASRSSAPHTAQQQPATAARQRRFSIDSTTSNTTATASASASASATAAVSGRRISIVDREAPRRVSDDKPPRPTKAFDPDALNSVQRHAASKAGLADAILKMRKATLLLRIAGVPLANAARYHRVCTATAMHCVHCNRAEKERHLFRARPLPQSHNQPPAVQPSTTAASRRGSSSDTTVTSATGTTTALGLAGVPKELLAALAQDPEGAALLEQIRAFPDVDVGAILAASSDDGSDDSASTCSSEEFNYAAAASATDGDAPLTNGHSG